MNDDIKLSLLAGETMVCDACGKIVFGGDIWLEIVLGSIVWRYCSVCRGHDD